MHARSIETASSAAVRVVAVLIVRDEAHHLHDCLTALRALVDAIVVVDTGSRDGSPAIAAALGAVVGHFPWNGRFDDARNHALAVAKSAGRFDFFLSVDADERVSALGSAAVRWRDSLDPRAHVGATVSFVSHEDSLPYEEPRLFALRDDLRWQNALHETPLVDAYRLQHTEGLAFGQVPLRFLHLGYSVDAKARKRQRDLAMLQAAVIEQPNRSYIFMELANTLSALDRHDEAAVAWERAVALTRAELRASAEGLDVMRWVSNAPPYEAVQSGVLGGALAYTLARQGTFDAEGEGLLAEARRAFPADDFLRWLEVAHFASRGAHEEVLHRGLALLRAPGERRGVPLSLFAREVPKVCALSAVALGQLPLARELCADLELRRRIDAMSAGGALARATATLSLPPDAQLTDQGDGGLLLELEGERVFFHGTSAFVVASLAEPTSPEQITRELSESSGRPLADAEDAVARSLRLLVFSGMLSLDGSALAGRPVAHYDPESSTVLCFGLPATLAGARRRAREVLDLARAQNLSPVLLPEPSQPYATEAVARGLAELGSAEAAALLDRARRGLVLPSDAPIPIGPFAELTRGQARVLPDVPLRREDRVAFAQLRGAAVVLEGALLASLLAEARTADTLVARAFDPSARLVWEAALGDDARHTHDAPVSPATPTRVVAIVPYYRCARWLGRALHSLVTQTRAPDTIVVVADAADAVPDGIVSEFPSVTFTQCREHVGPYALTQAVIDATDHEWIMIQDADDWSAVDRLERQLAFAQREGAELVSADLCAVDERAVLVQYRAHPAKGAATARSTGHYVTPHPAALMRRSLVERIGGFSTAWRVSADVELACRAACTTELHTLPGAYVYYGIRDDSLTHSLQTGLSSELVRQTRASIAEGVARRARAANEGALEARELAPSQVRPRVRVEHTAGPGLPGIPAAPRRT